MSQDLVGSVLNSEVVSRILEDSSEEENLSSAPQSRDAHLHGECISPVPDLDTFMFKSAKLEAVDPSINIRIQLSSLEDDGGDGSLRLDQRAEPCGGRCRRLVWVEGSRHGDFRRGIGFSNGDIRLGDSRDELGQTGE